MVDRAASRPGAANAVPTRLGRYAMALALYVALAVATLGGHHNVVLLNWIVGPLFPFIALYVVPRGVGSVTGRRARR